jgi:hypothetical protein
VLRRCAVLGRLTLVDFFAIEDPFARGGDADNGESYVVTDRECSVRAAPESGDCNRRWRRRA